MIGGIGKPEDNFEIMKELDADNKRLKKQKRDCVQFVCLNDIKQEEKKFSEELLAEVPSQLGGYFSSIGIKPNDPKEDLKEY